MDYELTSEFIRGLEDKLRTKIWGSIKVDIRGDVLFIWIRNKHTGFEWAGYFNDIYSLLLKGISSDDIVAITADRFWRAIQAHTRDTYFRRG